MGLSIDLKLIQEAKEKNRESLESLREEIKSMPVGKVDELIHPVAEEISLQIDCTQCGNCCKVQEPGVSPEEIRRLAGYRELTVEEFKDEFIGYSSDGTGFICQHPCLFLDDKVCSIYEGRPWSCADYPGLGRPRIKWRWKQVMENYSICPIVFHTVEKIRVELISGSRW